MKIARLPAGIAVLARYALRLRFWNFDFGLV